MSKLAKYLNQHVVGNVFDTETIRAAYTRDRSILEIMPRLVVFPETTQDLRKLVRFVNQLAAKGYRLPITVRGSGRDKTGAAIGSGMLISTERLDRLEEIDVRGRLVRVQPGITLKQLNTALNTYGLCLPIDYDPESTIGGLISTCPNDDAADCYGGIYHFVERAELVLASGDLVQLAPYSAHATTAKMNLTSFEGALYRQLDQLLDAHGDTIMDRSMRPFDPAGYANITKVRQGHGLNLLPLIFAAQGTLGVISDVILHVEPQPAEIRHLMVSFHDRKAMLRFLNFVRTLEPYEVQFYDLRIIQAAAAQGNRPELLHNSIGQGWLVMVSFNHRRHKNLQKLERCLNYLDPNLQAVSETAANTEAFRDFRSALLSFLNESTDGERAPALDDVRIPEVRLDDFFDGLALIEQTLGVPLPLFGSFLTANYQLRPPLHLGDLDGREQLAALMKQYGRLVRQCGGSTTGGSPEGRTKVLAGRPPFSPEELALYQELKAIFDPNNILNPEVKLGAEVPTAVRYLRRTAQSGVMTP